MSGAYSLFHVINELLDEKANKNSTARGKTMGAKSEIYQGSWNALNAWMETRLAKQKGAGISGFGCFCWELKQKGDVTQCRPIFIISDAFVKNFRVRRERIHRLPETTAIEEVNYSLLAIKFSNSLTKDMVFSGLRDIVKKIGDFIDRGYEIEIPFTFGTLYAKEKRVKFEFNQARLLEILPDRIQPGTLGFGKAPTHLFDETESESGAMSYRGDTPTEGDRNADQGSGAHNAETGLGQTARRVGTAFGKTRQPNKVPSLLAATRDDATSFLDSIDEEEPPQKASFTQTKSGAKVPPLTMNLTFTDTGSSAGSPEHHSPPQSAPYNDTYAESERGDEYYGQDNPANNEAPPDLKALLTTLSRKTTKAAKDEFRNQARNRVLEQAYLRCLNAVENGAHMDDTTTAEARQLLEDWKRKTSQMRAQKHMDAQALRGSLDSQMAFNAKRAEDVRLDKKNSIMAFILPGDGKNRTPAAQATAKVDENGNLISSRVVVSRILEDQIAKNAMERTKARQSTLSSERDYLNRLSMEIELHNAMDRSSQLEKQRSLLEAWERDGHIRNLKKLQPFGVEPVQDYIQRNLASDPTATSTGPLNYTSTVRPSDTMKLTGFGATLSKTLGSTSQPTIANKLNMSIGYDPRKPKLDW